jgi:hypothetical protein
MRPQECGWIAYALMRAERREQRIGDEMVARSEGTHGSAFHMLLFRERRFRPKRLSAPYSCLQPRLRPCVPGWSSLNPGALTMFIDTLERAKLTR